MRTGYLALVIGLGTFALQILPYLALGFASTLPPPVNSVPDLIDLLIYAPFTAATFYALYIRVVSGTPTPLRWGYIFSYMLFFEGHGLHWAANSINVYTGETLWVAYFLDEIISHKVMFTGIFLLIALGGLSELYKKNGDNGLMPPLIGGIVMGFSASLMFIEGQSAPEFMAASILYILLYLLLRLSRGVTLKEKPFLTFSITSTTFTVIFMLIYLAIFHSFIQPSEWF